VNSDDCQSQIGDDAVFTKYLFHNRFIKDLDVTVDNAIGLILSTTALLLLLSFRTKFVMME